MFVRILEEKDAAKDRQIVVSEIGPAVLGFVWSTLLSRAQAVLWSFHVSMWTSTAWWGAPAIMLCIKPVQSFLLQNLPFRFGAGNFFSNNEVCMVGFGRLASVLSLLSVGAAVAISAYNQRLTRIRCPRLPCNKIDAPEPEYEKSPEGFEASATT